MKKLVSKDALKCKKTGQEVLTIFEDFGLRNFSKCPKKCLTLTKHNFLNSNPNGANFISLESWEQEEQLSCWRNFQMELTS